MKHQKIKKCAPTPTAYFFNDTAQNRALAHNALRQLYHNHNRYAYNGYNGCEHRTVLSLPKGYVSRGMPIDVNSAAPKYAILVELLREQRKHWTNWGEVVFSHGGVEYWSPCPQHTLGGYNRGGRTLEILRENKLFHGYPAMGELIIPILKVVK